MKILKQNEYNIPQKERLRGVGDSCRFQRCFGRFFFACHVLLKGMKHWLFQNQPFKRQIHKMVKHTQAIRRQQGIKWLNNSLQK